MRILQKMEIFFQESRDRFVSRVTSGSMIEKDSLTYWRVNILFSLLLVYLILFPITFTAAIFLIIEEKIWNMIIASLLGYGLCFYLVYSRRASYRTRASIPLLIVYVMGVGITLYIGPLSSGPLCLFFFAIMAGIFLGTRASILAVALNGITLTLFAWLIGTGRFGQDFPFLESTRAIVSIITDFILLNLVTALSVTMLVRGLTNAHQKEKELTTNLDIEHRGSIAAKEKLEQEIKDREQAEEALQGERNTAQKYLDIAGVIIVAVDKKGTISLINKKGCKDTK